MQRGHDDITVRQSAASGQHDDWIRPEHSAAMWLISSDACLLDIEDASHG